MYHYPDINTYSLFKNSVQDLENILIIETKYLIYFVYKMYNYILYDIEWKLNFKKINIKQILLF